MATIYGTVSVDVIDAYGITGQLMLNVEIPDTATLAQLATDVAALVASTQAMSQGIATKATTRLTYAGSGDSPADALGDIEKGALFNLKNGTDAYLYGALVPDPSTAILNGAGLVDLTSTPVTDFISLLTTAHPAITYITKGARPLTALNDALITFRKHRKPLARKTKEIV